MKGGNLMAIVVWCCCCCCCCCCCSSFVERLSTEGVRLCWSLLQLPEFCHSTGELWNTIGMSVAKIRILIWSLHTDPVMAMSETDRVLSQSKPQDLKDPRNGLWHCCPVALLRYFSQPQKLQIHLGRFRPCCLCAAWASKLAWTRLKWLKLFKNL